MVADDARSTASPGASDWNDPAKQPPGHLGCRGLLDAPRRRVALLGGRPGLRHLRDDRRRRLLDAAQPRAARRLAAREPRGRLLRAQARDVAGRHDRLYQQNHCGMHRSDDAGRTWSRSPRACRRDFGFAAAAHPHDRDSFYVIPLDPATGAACPTAGRPSGARATPARAGGGSTPGCRSSTRTSASCARAWRSTRSTRRACTSARARPGVRERRRGRDLERDRELPAGDRLGRGRDVA